MQGLTYTFMCGSMYANNANYMQSKTIKLHNNTKQGINIHAKAYKVIVTQYKAIKH